MLIWIMRIVSVFGAWTAFVLSYSVIWYFKDDPLLVTGSISSTFVGVLMMVGIRRRSRGVSLAWPWAWGPAIIGAILSLIAGISEAIKIANTSDGLSAFLFSTVVSIGAPLLLFPILYILLCLRAANNYVVFNRRMQN